jgi:lysozyme
MTAFGIDVSHHQNPAAVPWDSIAATSSFCICRTTYGRMRDRQVAEHMRRARAAGLQVGVYHFFRPSQPVEDQCAALRAAAQAADYRPGDIVPALDVEADPIPTMQHVKPDWEPKVRRMAEAMAVAFGAQPLIYITQREWGMLGRPMWMTDYPLWVAHYTPRAKPATPGDVAATIWQHRVGPYSPSGPGGYFDVPGTLQLDQNRLLGRLPLAQRVPWEEGSTPRQLEEADDGLEALALSVAARSAVDDVLDDARREMTTDGEENH